MQRQELGLDWLLITAGQHEQEGHPALLAALKHDPVALEHLVRGHAQGSQRIIDVRVRASLVEHEVRSPRLDLGEGIVERLAIRAEVIGDGTQRAADAVLAAAYWKGKPSAMLSQILATVSALNLVGRPSGRLAQFLTSVREIERQTGLDFYSELSKGVQEKMETVKAAGVW